MKGRGYYYYLIKNKTEECGGHENRTHLSNFLFEDVQLTEGSSCSILCASRLSITAVLHTGCFLQKIKEIYRKQN